jgi:hypothetical protein
MKDHIANLSNHNITHLRNYVTYMKDHIANLSDHNITHRRDHRRQLGDIHYGMICEKMKATHVKTKFDLDFLLDADSRIYTFRRCCTPKTT